MSDTIQTFEFQAEARQLLDLMIHSIYSNKDIFLRELISNSSDALDRLRFEAVRNPELLPPDEELHIRLEVDKENRTLSVIDNGIGMTREEVIDLIGTIAKSGTREFLAAVQEAKEKGTDNAVELIGQFGVGFYSAFMVADRVTLVTRKAGSDKAVRWESSGEGTYTLEDVERERQGTTVTLHLKDPNSEDGLFDYTQEWKIREIVKKYSDFVSYPIRMRVERTEVKRDADGKPLENEKPETRVVDEVLNSMKAIWLRDKDEVSEEDYHEFYKHISHDWNEPLRVIRATMEGTLLYRMLLFIPSKAPFDLYMREHRRGVQLYVKRVFIMDDCDALVPAYLRFVRGVVDSEDLSLNISREILQQNRQVNQMRKGLTRKVLEDLKSLMEKDRETYLKFYAEFGPVLKEGLYEDPANRETLLNLMLFESTHDASQRYSLREYVERMKPEQKAIYYITGPSRKAVEQSPHLEAFRKKGYEVLILTDSVDEIWPQSVPEYDGKPLQSVGKGTVELGSEEERKKEEEERKKARERHASLFESIKNHLDEYIKEVRVSSRLTDSLVCLVGEPGDMSPQMEALMRAMNKDLPSQKRILELNPSHPVVAHLQALYDANPEDPRIGEYAKLLYGQALLAEGILPPEPAAFGKQIAALMSEAMEKK